MKHGIKLALGVPEIMQYERYLGLPSFVGKGKKESFNYIKKRVWQKLQGWEDKLLSQAQKGSALKVNHTSHPYIHNGMFQITIGFV